jgi:hypothetical protein
MHKRTTIPLAQAMLSAPLTLTAKEVDLVVSQ